MKKLKSTLILILIALFFGCQQNETEVIPAPENKLYAIQNGIVRFVSFEAYKTFLETGTEAQKLSFIKNVANNPGYTSLHKALSHRKPQSIVLGVPIYDFDPVNDPPVIDEEVPVDEGEPLDDDVQDDIEDILSSDLLSSFVNAEGVVQIGTYFFKIDLFKEKCYALHTNVLSRNEPVNYYGLLLKGDSQNSFVFEFSTDDDVLDMLVDMGNPVSKEGIAPSMAKRCGETGVPRLKMAGKHRWPRYDKYVQDFMDCKVVYQKAGIYFSLLGKMLFKASGQGNWQSRRDWFYWKFKPKCWNERYQPYTTSFTTNAGNGYTRRAWESTRGLSKYDISFQWEVLGHARTSNSLLRTKVYTIKAGY